MTAPSPFHADSVNPVRDLLPRTPPHDGHPHRVALRLLAPAWAALSEAETAFLAHKTEGPGPLHMTALADLCNWGGDLVADTARSVVSGEPQPVVDETLHRASDLAYLFALVLPQLPAAVRAKAEAVTVAFAVGRQPDLYIRVLDTVTEHPDFAEPGDDPDDDDRTTHEFAVAARGVRFDRAVRGIRRAQARMTASMVPLARLAAGCIAGTAAPHDEVGGMRRDVALFVASVDDDVRTLLDDLSAWLLGSPAHHARGRPADWCARSHDALETLRTLDRAPGHVVHRARGDAADRAMGRAGPGYVKWIEWAARDMGTLMDVLAEHQDAVAEWHRALGLVPSLPAHAGDEGDAVEGDSGDDAGRGDEPA